MTADRSGTAAIVGAALLPACIEAGATWRAFRPTGSHTAVRVAEVTFLCSMLALVAGAIFVVAFIGGRMSGRGRMSLATLLLPCVLALSGFAGLELAAWVRESAFARFAQRSSTVIDALYGYERVHGRFPEQLGDLVPEELPSLPRTGFGAYPSYRYLKEAAYPIEDLRGNPWALVVEIPFLQSFDRLVFLPNGDYDGLALGGRAALPVQDWVHVVEE